MNQVVARLSKFNIYFSGFINYSTKQENEINKIAIAIEVNARLPQISRAICLISKWN